jgi:hypothetical protein
MIVKVHQATARTSLSALVYPSMIIFYRSKGTVIGIPRSEKVTMHTSLHYHFILPVQTRCHRQLITSSERIVIKSKRVIAVPQSPLSRTKAAAYNSLWFIDNGTLINDVHLLRGGIISSSKDA